MHTRPAPTVLNPEQVSEGLNNGMLLLDVRAGQDFAAGHIPGSINIGLGGQFASWAAVLLPLDQAIVLIAEDATAAEEASMRLARVGMENIVGQLEGGISSWMAKGKALVQTNQLTADELSGHAGDQGTYRLDRRSETR